MSSLAPGRILPGARWNYRILDTVKGDNTHNSAVFKAQVISPQNAIDHPQTPRLTLLPRAIIKTVSPSDAIAKDHLDHERQIYLLPDVGSTPCFRQIYDVIDNNTVALEWLDTTLAEVRYQPDRRTYALIKTALRAALTSYVVLERQKICEYRYMGDLGLVFSAGRRINAQPYAMRAPEVFLGEACTEPSQVWAVAAMMLCWIKPHVLGADVGPHPPTQ
ncbi:hypothetical protein F5X99DRAFT_408402 [Biscogniauxia marginata]|nr:hypothetical protein F5X99DRAFT_408402 [Biscogniauxia marginata]